MTATIQPKNIVHIDSRRSYTPEEAAAQMLSWLHGEKRRRYIPEFGEGENSPGPTAFLDGLNGSMEPLWEALRSTRKAYYSAESAGEAFDVLHTYRKQIEDLRALKYRYESYLVDVRSEIEKGKSSLLKSFPVSGADNSVVFHITRYSLEKWIRSRYKISVIGQPTAWDTNDPVDTPEQVMPTIVRKDDADVTVQRGEKTTQDDELSLT